jgi:hypothetical protein
MLAAMRPPPQRLLLPLLGSLLLAPVGAQIPVPNQPPARPDPPRAMAIVGATIHSQEPGQVPEVGTVLILGERIQGRVAEGTLSQQVERIDGSGKHLVPGLIDGLVNFDPAHDLLYLAAGVTLVRDMGGDAGQVATLRDASFRDRVPGPALLTAGAVLDGDPPLSAAAVAVDSEDKLRDAIVQLAQAYKVDFLSIQPNFKLELLPALARLSREQEREIWGLPPRGADLSRLIGWRGVSGLDVLLPKDVQWSFVQGPAFAPGIALMRERGLAVVPLAGEARRRMQRGDPLSPDFELLDSFYEVEWLSEWGLREPRFDERFLETGKRVDQKRLELLKNLHGAGVELLPGSGAPLAWNLPGRALLEELDDWVRAGLPPEEVLALATRGAAALVGQSEERGRIAPGMVADLLLLDGDPRQGLAPLRDPACVVVRGRALSRAAIAQGLDELRDRRRAERERDRQPLVLPELELPPGEPLLAGQVETRYLGKRLSGERFAVLQSEGSNLDVITRLYVPPSGDLAESQLEAAQRLVDGRLTNFAFRLLTGGDELILRGSLVAGQLRLERKYNGSVIATQVTEEQPVAVVLSPLTDTVATALVLGQWPTTGSITVLELADQLEPVLDRWLIQDAPDGSRWVRNQQGWMRFAYRADGAPERISRGTGRQAVEVLPSEVGIDNFGGAGLPVRFVSPVEPQGPKAPGVLEEAGPR